MVFSQEQQANMKRLLLISILISTTFLFCQEEYEIEVLGKRIPFTYNTKRNVLIVKGEFLKNLPCLNLPQLLSFVANMNFVMRGNFQADPQMMGFNQEQVLVMVNDIPMNNAQTGHHRRGRFQSRTPGIFPQQCPVVVLSNRCSDQSGKQRGTCHQG